MTNAAPSEAARADVPSLAIPWAIAGILLVTAWRLAMLRFDRLDLYVDDAQYWLWGQELAWGYFSKPPLIGWILRLSTEIGSNDPFWIRAPLPIIHGLTALVVALAARRLYGPRTGGLAGFAVVTLPGVAVGSLFVSTDTPMLLCFALALLAFLRLREGPAIGWAVVLGAAIGVGMLAKYAMIYFVICALLAAAVMSEARIARRDAAIAGGIALALIAPNLAWNLENGLSTLRHTADNTRLAGGPALRPLDLLEFWGGQFAVAGPVLFGAYLAGLARVRRDPIVRFLALMSLPVFAIVSVQALLAGAQTNWAAAGHVGAVIVAMAVLAPRRRLLAAGLAINLAATIALPLMAAFPQAVRLPSGEPALARNLGRAEISLMAAEIARAEGLDTIVSSSRGILADAFYTLRDASFAIRAEPEPGPPAHHYAQRHALEPGPGAVLYVTRRTRGPGCVEGAAAPVRVAEFTPATGFAAGQTHAFYRVERACWFGP